MPEEQKKPRIGMMEAICKIANIIAGCEFAIEKLKGLSEEQRAAARYVLNHEIHWAKAILQELPKDESLIEAEVIRECIEAGRKIDGGSNNSIFYAVSILQSLNNHYQEETDGEK